MPDVYTHGHDDAVLRSHRWRTAENSAGYLLPSLQPHHSLLDVGCGPGTITIDLAKRLAQGSVIGIDAAPEIVDTARKAAEQAGVKNARFEVGDVYALEHADETFDVAHAHQVLQHLSEPVRALREMLRVLRPGGLLAVRDGDYGAFTWAPAVPLLDRWNELYHAVTRRNDAEADAGRYLLEWVHAAGFDDATYTSSNWTFADAESRSWWAGLWAERVRATRFGEQAVSYGLAEPDEISAIADAWEQWARDDDAVFIVVHGEVLARRT